MNQKFLLFGVILLVLVGAGSYFLGTKKSQPVQTNSLSISPTAVQTNETSDKTTNWKTYTTLTYSIKYPTEFEATNSDSKSNIVDKTGAFNLAISTEPTNLNLHSYLVEKSWCSTINSNNGTLYLIDSENSLRFEKTPCGQTGSTDIYTIRNGTAYHFSIPTQANYDNYLSVLNQILSTFRFTQ